MVGINVSEMELFVGGFLFPSICRQVFWWFYYFFWFKVDFILIFTFILIIY